MFDFLLRPVLQICIVFAISIASLIFYFGRKDINIKPAYIIPYAIVFIMWGVVWLRFFAIIEAGGNIERAANMRLYGLLFATPMIPYLCSKFFKMDLRQSMDYGSIVVAITLFIGRIDCFVEGCCQGTLIPGMNGMKWPIREAEIVFYIIFVIYAISKIRNKLNFGELYVWLLIDYGLLRFILELFRDEFTGIGSFHLALLWSIVSLFMGLSLMPALRTVKKRKV